MVDNEVHLQFGKQRYIAVRARSKLDKKRLIEYRSRLRKLLVPDAVIDCFDENDFGIGNPGKAAVGKKGYFYRRNGLSAAANAIDFSNTKPMLAAKVLMWSLGRIVVETLEGTVMSKTSPTPTAPPIGISTDVLSAIFSAWEQTPDLPDDFSNFILWIIAS